MLLRCISETSHAVLQRHLKSSQIRLWVASETVIISFQSEALFCYLLIYLLVFKYFGKLIGKPKLYPGYLCKRKTFRSYGESKIPLSFLYLIIFKKLIFSYTLPSAGKPFRKTTAIPTYRVNLRKRFHLKDTTKTSIKTMKSSSLRNTDLGNCNDSSLI